MKCLNPQTSPQTAHNLPRINLNRINLLLSAPLGKTLSSQPAPDIAVREYPMHYGRVLEKLPSK